MQQLNINDNKKLAKRLKKIEKIISKIEKDEDISFDVTVSASGRKLYQKEKEHDFTMLALIEEIEDADSK